MTALVGTIRVFIAEDKDVVRLGLKQLIQQIDGAEVVGMAADGETALREILSTEPSVALIKDELPGMEMTDVIQES